MTEPVLKVYCTQVCNSGTFIAVEVSALLCPHMVNYNFA